MITLLHLIAKIIAALVLLAVFGTILWGVYFYNAHKFTNTSWREQLTLTIETPSGEVTGAAVVEVTARCGKPVMGNEVFYRVIGEATVVEISPGRYLFALIDTSGERFYRAAKGRFKGMWRCDWLKLIPKQTDPVSLTGQYRPRLVTFGDINDPTTVKMVDPDDLAASLGASVRLKSIELAITTEPVTPWQNGAINKVLPQTFFDSWGTIHRAAVSQGVHAPYFKSFLGQLARSDFQRGKK